MKNLLFPILVMFTIFSMASCTDEIFDTSDNVNSRTKNSPSVGIEYINQRQAIESYKKIMLSFNKNKKNAETSVYPDYYGGCYIDENANLVVYVMGDIAMTRTSLVNVAGENIITKSCKYSFKTLNEIMEVVNSFTNNNINSPITNNIAVVSLMDKENKITVKLLDYNEQKIAEFQKMVTDSPAITFEKAEGRIKPYYGVVCPGYEILGVVGGFSLGYRAIRYGVEGYVTAGHGVKYNELIAADGIQFAKCTDWQYSGNVDAAFCESKNTVDYSNRINGTSISLGSSIQDPISGLLIYKSGKASGVTSGFLISSSTQIWTTDNVKLTDIASANYVSTYGDSGGIVYVNPYGFEGVTCGIVQGGSGSTSYFVKASNINSALGCSVY